VRDQLRREGVDGRLGAAGRLTSLADAVQAFEDQARAEPGSHA